MAEVCPAELANMQVAAIPLRNVEYPMQTVATTTKVGCKNQLTCRSGIQERHARHHRMRLMAMNDIGRAQVLGQKRIQGIKPEPPKVDPVSQHLDIELPTTLLPALRAESDECRRNSFRHGTAQFKRVPLSSAKNIAEEVRRDMKDTWSHQEGRFIPARAAAVHAVPFNGSLSGRAMRVSVAANRLSCRLGSQSARARSGPAAPSRDRSPGPSISRRSAP